MDSSVAPKDEIWFLRVCHYISNAVYIPAISLIPYYDAPSASLPSNIAMSLLLAKVSVQVTTSGRVRFNPSMTLRFKIHLMPGTKGF
jgi:hypothetical protein